MAMPNWDTGAKSPTTVTEGTTGTGWTNKDNVKTSNNTYATVTLASGNSKYLDCVADLRYAADVPSIARVDGIKVEIDRYGTGIKDVTVQLVIGGSVVGSNKADTSTDWGSSETTATYGGASDLWGATWNGYQMSSAYGFGVRVQCQYNSGTNPVAYIDHIRITVYYSCHIFTPAEDAWEEYNIGLGVSYLETGDDLKAGSTSSQDALQWAYGSTYNTAASLQGLVIDKAEYQVNLNTVVDYTVDGSSGFFFWYIGCQFGSTMEAADLYPFTDYSGTRTGDIFWSTYDEPLTDGAGYYSVEVTAWKGYINQNPSSNSGYTGIACDGINSGNDFIPESTYVLVDSMRKSGGLPQRLIVTTLDTDVPLRSLMGVGT